MSRKLLYIGLGILLVVIITAGIYKTTGFASGGSVVGKCTDTDNGKDIYTKGTTNYTNRNYKYEDYCIQPGKVREHWCLFGDMVIRAKTYRCPSECEDGRCINISS